VDKLHDRLATVDWRDGGCTDRDFADLIEDESCNALLYLDPPYYRKGNELYQHGFSANDHERLAMALQKTKHAWVLSYDDCYEIRQLYRWACVEPLDVNYSITATKGGLSRTKSELLIVPKWTQGAQRVFGDRLAACAG
jgi:DNA adenine methylase